VEVNVKENWVQLMDRLANGSLVVMQGRLSSVTSNDRSNAGVLEGT
jgi:hypothetical protein